MAPHHPLLNSCLKRSPSRVVVGDFGCIFEPIDSLQRANGQKLQQTGGGDPVHYAPEMCFESVNSSTVCDLSKADVWAVVLMAYEMVTGRKGGEILPYGMKQVTHVLV